MFWNTLVGSAFFVAVFAAVLIALRSRPRRTAVPPCREPRRVLSDEDDVASAASPRVSWESRQHIAEAIAEWMKVRRREDAHWDLAFGYLRDTLDRDCHLDVRLYLYNYSQDAIDLYNQFMTEEAQWAAMQ